MPVNTQGSKRKRVDENQNVDLNLPDIKDNDPFAKKLDCKPFVIDEQLPPLFNEMVKGNQVLYDVLNELLIFSSCYKINE